MALLVVLLGSGWYAVSVLRLALESASVSINCKMGLSDIVIKASFKTDADGAIVFYPWGRFGKGYVIPGESKKRQIKQFVKLWLNTFQATMIIVSALGVVVAILLDLEWEQVSSVVLVSWVVCTAVWMLVFSLKIRRLVAGLSTRRH